MYFKWLIDARTTELNDSFTYKKPFRFAVLDFDASTPKPLPELYFLNAICRPLHLPGLGKTVDLNQAAKGIVDGEPHGPHALAPRPDDPVGQIPDEAKSFPHEPGTGPQLP